VGKVDADKIAEIKSIFETGDFLLEESFIKLIDIVADAAEDHEHTSSGGPGTGTGDAKALYTIGAFVWIIPGDLDTGAGQGPRLPGKPDITFLEAELTVVGAPTGQALIVDINKNGTSLWAENQENRPQIAASATEGETTSFDTATGTDDDIYTLDIDQKGSGDPGTTLAAFLWYKQYAAHDA
jgi:hypothetical protein